jgi:hypothetical protein
MPWFNPEYYAYFWVGLERVFGAEALRIDPAGFPPPSHPGFHRHRDTFAFVVDGRRYFISANDHGDIAEAALEWADVVGSVNVVADAQGPAASVVPMGPSFGVRAWNTSGALALVRRFARSARPPALGWRALMATLRRQRQRLPIESYEPTPSAPSAGIWYLGTFWADHPEANLDRVRFLRAARAVGARLDGGLVPLAGDLPAGLSDLAASGVDQSRYVAGVRGSAIAFNHPAVHGCLGWKLGEYLALGKAILTTPVDRVLPVPLEHGTHWHVADPTAEGLAEAIELLMSDGDYRRHLERGARRYFDDWVEPRAAITRLSHHG